MRTKSLAPTWSHCSPPIDTSMPPPPPRTPWVDPSQVNSHTRLSRQLSVNPTYDPRIHQPKPHQDFSRPPPPVPRHMTVSRNASAPGQPAKPTKVYTVEPTQTQVSNSDSQLHKTWSSPVGENTPFQASGIWDSHGMPRSGLPTQDRSKLYFHLANVFPEDKVMRAMNAMPNETDPEVICRLICSEKWTLYCFYLLLFQSWFYSVIHLVITSQCLKIALKVSF